MVRSGSVGEAQQLGVGLALALVLAAPPALAWAPLQVAQDPLVRMPGTQPGDGVSLEAPNRCLNCHADYDGNVEPGFLWQGSMMAQAARDPFFWATMTVAAQDAIWLLGNPNATDLCLRCHMPAGWLEGRSDPTNAENMSASDFDGVQCDLCHRMFDPFFEDTFAGLREGDDWSGYWDEAGSQAAAEAALTLAEDAQEAAGSTLFNGNPFFGNDDRPVPPEYNENASGQYFVASGADKRGPFADAAAKHQWLYSRYHRSRYFCSTCHDVSNPALANLSFVDTTPGDGTTVLPSEDRSAFEYGHVERTFSEFALSDFGVGEGAFGSGPFAPDVFDTPRPNDRIAACQDCHMAIESGVGCNKSGTPLRPDQSTEHPSHGVPTHDLTGANYLVPWILASTVPGSSNHDAVNESLLRQGPATLTLDLDAGLGLNPDALLAGAARALANLENAASIEALSYDAGSGAVSFRLRNHTGHKLPTGYPEGRRMFVNIRVYSSGTLVEEYTPYDSSASTLRGLDPAESPNSPPLGVGEVFDESLVYEAKSSSSITGESHSFHFLLADGFLKDNRIPPQGFRIAEAAERLAEPVWQGAVDANLFTAQEYSGGHDDVSLTVQSGATGIQVNLFYQTVSREYVEFLQGEIEGTSSTLDFPTPSGEAEAYIAQSDAFFSSLAAWGTTLWQLWDHNRNVPGAAPILMTSAQWGTLGDPCALAGSDGNFCNDGDLCTLTDSCQGGECVGANPVLCTALDQCHVAGTCDPNTGACDDPVKSDGSGCDDGDLCTASDTCQGGACQGAGAIMCTQLDECHEAGTCDPETGVCSDPQRPDGESCSGGQCEAGVCVLDGTGGTSTSGTGGVGGTGVSGTGGVGGTGASGGAGGIGGGGAGGNATGGSGGAGTGGAGTGGMGGAGTGTGGAGPGGTAGSGGFGASAGEGGTGNTDGGVGASGGGAGASGSGGGAGAGATSGAASGGGPGTGGALSHSGGGPGTGGAPTASGGGLGEGGENDGGDGTPTTGRKSGGCGCSIPGHGSVSAPWALWVLALLWRRFPSSSGARHS